MEKLGSNYSTIIHVSAELLIAGALTFYITKRTGTLQAEINLLKEKIAKQDDIIKQQGDMINQHTQILQQLLGMRPQPQGYSPYPQSPNIQQQAPAEQRSASSSDDDNASGDDYYSYATPTRERQVEQRQRPSKVKTVEERKNIRKSSPVNTNKPKPVKVEDASRSRVVKSGKRRQQPKQEQVIEVSGYDFDDDTQTPVSEVKSEQYIDIDKELEEEFKDLDALNNILPTQEPVKKKLKKRST